MSEQFVGFRGRPWYGVLGHPRADDVNLTEDDLPSERWLLSWFKLAGITYPEIGAMYGKSKGWAYWVIHQAPGEKPTDLHHRDLWCKILSDRERPLLDRERERLSQADAAWQSAVRLESARLSGLLDRPPQIAATVIALPRAIPRPVRKQPLGKPICLPGRAHEWEIAPGSVEHHCRVCDQAWIPRSG